MRKTSAWLFLSAISSFCLLTTACTKTISSEDSEARTSYATVSSDLVDGGEVVGNFEKDWPYEWHAVASRNVAQQFFRGTRSQIPVREGNYAARFTVRPGDQELSGSSGERCEASHYNDLNHGYTQEKPNDDFYYGWSTYIPSNWVTPSGWCTFAQWHHRSFTLPPIAMNIGNNTIGIQFYTGLLKQLPSTWYANYTYNAGFTILNNVAKNVWHDFIVHIKFTPNNAGIVEVYHKLQSQSSFTQIFAKYNIPTMQMYYPAHWSTLDIDNAVGVPDNRLPWGNYLTTQAWCRVGLYRAPASFTNVIYHDNWARARWWSNIYNNF